MARLALGVKWSGHVKENTYMRIRAVMQKPWGSVFIAQNASWPGWPNCVLSPSANMTVGKPNYSVLGSGGMSTDCTGNGARSQDEQSLLTGGIPY